MKRSQSNVVAVLALLGLIAVIMLAFAGAIFIRQSQDANGESTLQSIYAQQTGSRFTLTMELATLAVQFCPTLYRDPAKAELCRSTGGWYPESTDIP